MLRAVSNGYRAWPLFSCSSRCVSVIVARCYSTENDNGKRSNQLGIQMLSHRVHSQIFRKSDDDVPLDVFNNIKEHLEKHELLGKDTSTAPDVSFQLPSMHGENIDEHFRKIAEDINAPYLELIRSLVSAPMLKLPPVWSKEKGWTRYDPKTGAPTRVDHPDCAALVFDVEVLVSHGGFPCLAAARSPTHWYSWCSRQVATNKASPKLQIEDMINLHAPNRSLSMLARTPPRLVVGHSVGYDRAYVQEQYYIRGAPRTRFMDTMSMHIAVAGLTSMQRLLYLGSKKEDGGMGVKQVREYKEKEKFKKTLPNFRWTKESSMNNLRDVHQLYCSDEPRLNKQTRDVFVKGDLSEVRSGFQDLMTYCATDVSATLSVFRELWPQYLERLPHPVTLAGMLEMSCTYLPVNQNWQKYIDTANRVYDSLQVELRTQLMALADEARQLTPEQYSKDIWLWDLDWSMKSRIADPRNSKHVSNSKSLTGKKPKRQKVQDPVWYDELYPRAKDYDQYPPGPSLISTARRVTPKLLRLTWNDYPVHHHDDHKWGYLVPDESYAGGVESQDIDSDSEEPVFPLKEFLKYCESKGKLKRSNLQEKDSDRSNGVATLKQVKFDLEQKIYTECDSETLIQLRRELYDANRKITDLSNSNKRIKKNSETCGIDIGIAGVLFMPLPHKDGPDNAVGSPLGKSYVQYIENGTLSSARGTLVDAILRTSQASSYWKMNKKRIEGQMALMFSNRHLPPEVRDAMKTWPPVKRVGAILPKLTVAGTVTRRAVEPTWLTASNAYEDRVGSELKAMVQSPPGYCFVGADVDSQELWIASLIGDSHFGGMHGCTAFGWMTLQGTKKEGTDLHSNTARLAGISRDHAKVFNYGRIYGAGQKFARQLLMQFNHKLTEDEAWQKAKAMYEATKGKRIRAIASQTDQESENGEGVKLWVGGTESAMFNKLEAIACMKKPQTPALDCSISKVLEPHNVDGDFMTSRVNWVVQSSGVDYLHLLLVCMHWLFQAYDIDGRFSISIHDEVRYLVKYEDRYRAALALQIANLYTRSLFAYKLGMHDLPQSVAFFSAIDIDTCLRKEVFMDCVTPSNPRGLQQQYGVAPGQALSVYQVLENTNGGCLDKQMQPKHVAATTDEFVMGDDGELLVQRQTKL